jgi:hypothetical protein
MAQVVEGLPSKCIALSSNPSTAKQQNKTTFFLTLSLLCPKGSGILCFRVQLIQKYTFKVSCVCVLFIVSFAINFWIYSIVI